MPNIPSIYMNLLLHQHSLYLVQSCGIVHDNSSRRSIVGATDPACVLKHNTLTLGN